VIAEVDEQRCSGCGTCVDACVEQAISLHPLATIDPERCIGCGACCGACPNEALSFGLQTDSSGRGLPG
jgi:ferredoxin